MCGIFGEIICEQQKLISKELFLSLLKLSRNRGPDSQGYFSNNKYFQFGFNRLSILDISDNAKQPMHSPSGRFTILFNGEIYNHIDLRNLLPKGKYLFKGNGDTESLIAYIDHFGIDKTVEKLDGMFAMGIFDHHKKYFYLIRDFAGIKPLYYGIRENKLVFASQYDQIFRHPNFCNSITPNFESLYDYSQFGYVSAPNAFFRDTWQVEPGEIVSFDWSLNISKMKYYEYSFSDQNLLETDIQTSEKLDTILAESVTNQLISDVPVGTFLSGGIDSPLISYYAHKVNSEIETFTIGSENPNFDETESAKHFASSMNVVNHLHYYSDEDLAQDMNEHFKAFSEPFGDYSSLPTFQVSKMAKYHFSVILGGDGGDEIFWGYPRFHQIADHLSWFDHGKNIRRISAGIMRKLGYNISYGIHLDNISDWVIAKHSHNHSQILKNILPGLSNSKFIKTLYSPKRNFDNKISLLNWLRWNEFYGHLQRVLMKVDRASMYHSLEVRVPFLGRNVLEISKRIYPELAITHHKPKYLLKKLMEDKFSNFTAHNQKMGFSIDIDNSLRTILKDEVYDLLLGRDPYPHNTFHRPNLKKYIESFFKEKNGNEWGIWILFSLQKWAESFDVNN